MFVSEDKFEFPVPLSSVDPGTSYWRAMSLSLHAPWFLLTFLVGSGDESLKHTVCIAWDSDLIAMLEANPSLNPCGLVYMKPGWACRSGHWESREIQTIWRGRDRHGSEVFIFVDAEGIEHSRSGERQTITGDRQLVLDVTQPAKA